MSTTTQPPETEEPEAMSETIETTTPVTTKPSQEQEVAAWSKTDAELRAIVEATKGVTIKDHVGGEKKGREAVHSALMSLVKPRTALDARKAELKRPALDLCNLIESEYKRLLAITAPREMELRKERDDWDAAQAKIEADRKEAERKAAHEKLQSRLNAMVAAGLPPEIGPATTLDDDAWGLFLGNAIEAKEAKDREDARIHAELDAAKAVADELTLMGDECTLEEAMALDDEQRTHRLTVARKADHDRREAQRIKDEEAAAERARVAAKEKADRERLERGSLRLREMSMLGAPADLDALADLTDEAYAVALETARQDKAERDRIAAEERTRQAVRDSELARLQQEAADRQRRDAEALERLAIPLTDPGPVKAPTLEIVPETAPVTAPVVLEAAVAVTSAEVLAWFDGIRAAINATPDSEADTRAAADKMLATVEEVYADFLPF